MDRELLLEIGVEELPAAWLPGLTKQLSEKLQARLKEMRLTPDVAVESFSTPRRLTARIGRMPERQEDLDETITGPPVSAAFNAAGEPTPAGARLREEAGRRLRGARARQDRQGRVPRARRSITAARARSTRCPSCSARCCAISRFPSRCTGTRCSRTARASSSSAARSAGCCTSTAAASSRSRSAARRTPRARWCRRSRPAR